MEYIINGLVTYDPLNGTLYVTDSGMDMVTLTRMTNELLLLLIQNNGTPLNRDFILSELWEKRGLSASSNNLNNYVSMLRKALAQCGFLDLITTIPKYGFIFEAEVESVAKSHDVSVDKHSAVDADSKQLPFLESGIQNPATRYFLTPPRIKVLVAAVSLLVIIFLPGIYSHFRLQSVRTEFFTLEQCDFYLANDKTRELASNHTINKLRAIVAKDKLNCGRKANVYYFADKKRDSSGRMILTDLLSYCPFNSKAPCDNYYLSRHKNQNEK
ncbi:TPA: winged helix-turn-helix transcriptional regulator [Raoultella planticola]|nr:winged helix-turn-helix transcriptional regulator [Raoultella planticola]